MNADLEHYMNVHNELISAMEKEPAGDIKAGLKSIIEKMRDEIIRAGNLIDEGKNADKVFNRIDLIFNNKIHAHANK